MKQGIFSAEQGILPQEQGILSFKIEIIADGVFGTHRFSKKYALRQ
jgi:hypothetical protein